MQRRHIILLLAAALATGCGQTPPATGESASKDSAVNVQPAPELSAGSWAGNWSRPDIRKDGGGMEITAVTKTGMHVLLQAVNGGHTGEIDEDLRINGNTAEYAYRDEYDDCLVTFRLHGDSVIEVNQMRRDCGAAMGVSFSGRYRRRTLENTTTAKSAETMLSLGIFDKPAQDAAFRELTGASYESFVSNTQLNGDDEDIDGLDTKVKSSGVRGLFTLMEQITMIDAQNNIWAATIDDDTVRYFTNGPRFRNELPQTIERWRERFRDKPLVIVAK